MNWNIPPKRLIFRVVPELQGLFCDLDYRGAIHIFRLGAAVMGKLPDLPPPTRGCSRLTILSHIMVGEDGWAFGLGRPMDGDCHNPVRCLHCVFLGKERKETERESKVNQWQFCKARL